MKRMLIAACSGALLLVTACDPSSTDFKKETEKFIEGKDFAGKTGTTYTGASCVQPTSIKVGTKYTCTAKAPDGTSTSFDVEIYRKNGFQVSFGGAPGAATTTTVAGGATASTVATPTTTTHAVTSTTG